MGPYCKFCDNRCFVERILPGQESRGVILLATCGRGMNHDREACGFDHTTAINPYDKAAR
jgi:hypothetical protein